MPKRVTFADQVEEINDTVAVNENSDIEDARRDAKIAMQFYSIFYKRTQANMKRINELKNSVDSFAPLFEISVRNALDKNLRIHAAIHLAQKIFLEIDTCDSEDEIKNHLSRMLNIASEIVPLSEGFDEDVRDATCTK